MKFIFFGKILGYYYELDESNTTAKKDSKIALASTVKEFKENARKAFAGQKIIFYKVG